MSTHSYKADASHIAGDSYFLDNFEMTHLALSTGSPLLDKEVLARFRRKDCKAYAHRHSMLTPTKFPAILTSWTILRWRTWHYRRQQTVQQITITASSWRCELTPCRKISAPSAPISLCLQYLQCVMPSSVSLWAGWHRRWQRLCLAAASNSPALC